MRLAACRYGQEERDTGAETPFKHPENDRMALGEVAKPNPELQQRLTAGMVEVPMPAQSRQASSQSLELRNRRGAYARRRYWGYLGSVSDSARVDQHFLRANCSSVWPAPSSMSHCGRTSASPASASASRK